MVAVSAYMDGTHDSGVLSSAGDVLEMSVVVIVVRLSVHVHFNLGLSPRDNWFPDSDRRFAP